MGLRVRLFDCSTVRLFDCSTVRLFGQTEFAPLDSPPRGYTSTFARRGVAQAANADHSGPLARRATRRDGRLRVLACIEPGVRGASRRVARVDGPGQGKGDGWVWMKHRSDDQRFMCMIIVQLLV
jgi:hypothetical protein